MEKAFNSAQLVAQLSQQLIEDGDGESAMLLFRQTLLGLSRVESVKLTTDFAFLLWRCYEYGRAEGLFDELIQNPHIDSLVLQQIAKKLFVAGRFDRAARVMRVATASDDRSDSRRLAELYVQYAACLERSNQINEAVEAASQALFYNPSDHSAVRQLARIDRRWGNFETGIRRLNAHLQNHDLPHQWLVRYELAACLDRVGEFSQAWENLLLAKSELIEVSRPDLEISYRIRKRQGELVQRVTDADLRRWQGVAMGSTMKIAFLIGFPRSGTTLVESILMAHPQVIGTDETGILSSQFINPIIWQAADAMSALFEIRGWDNSQLLDGRNSYLKFTSAATGCQLDHRLLIEKDPLLTGDLLLPLRLFPEAKIIMPLRDPRDVTLSYFFNMIPFTWNSSPACNILESAKFYHDLMRHWVLLRNRLPWENLEIRYEDLIDNTLQQTQELAEFLDLSNAESMLEGRRGDSQRWIKTPSYDDIEKPIYDRAIGRWKNYEEQLQPALEILNPWARELGYS